ncbi:Fe-S cluster assembly protein SufD [Melissococcus plutonius]|uniref:Iron-sulfur cluster assembly protein SufD n=1 Tax=Melissococcus plutonius (strain ATCC 35311 / DSM 29964 / CIP 104052 / LMG 20360 / NCIMB 702443) TaxID=940190 RepID=F3YBT6_MELPT|nr:Fe-S cluster assembly protein SufD [Melissococcus plutonius]AIM25239.1 iron-sulfur cluster assembly protein SufD [Melissococcus plutonius S1]KMT23920.1 iron-sulfur cluster assembly protein SufD [Melissococcus plutonius]KMT24443.1 iron-sulfur cluster assembly protein SufD [Melissococcus plutonius]KMT26016.1 iron-sulfur cluster assembly protein SufD [Melissococcus plutonius]KMT28565.1 iron-sulfur cluster assembly protein SufD [Melissococcus plutonius]
MKDIHMIDYLEDIKAFSAEKEEPTWMSELRLDALKNVDELDLPKVDRVNYKRWPLFNVNINNYTPQPESLADFNQFADHSAIIQKSSFNQFEQLSKTLAEQGVIFTDLFTALLEFPDLVKEYYMTKAVKTDENKLTAVHTAFMNSGIFIYIPKNVVIKETLETLFIQDTDSDQPLFKHVLIIAEENSEMSYLERFQSTEDTLKSVSGNIVVEVIAKRGAKIKYTAVDQLGKNITSYIHRCCYLMQDAQIDWTIGAMNDGNTISNFNAELAGKGASAEVKVTAISSEKQIQGMNTQISNRCAHTVSHIQQHGVVLDASTLTFNGICHLLKGAKEADAQQENRVLMLSDKARGDANPILLIDENDVTAGHAASVGSLNADDLYYLMSRGLSKQVAERLIVHGFLTPMISTISNKEVQEKMMVIIDRKLAK